MWPGLELISVTPSTGLVGIIINNSASHAVAILYTPTLMPIISVTLFKSFFLKYIPWGISATEFKCIKFYLTINFSNKGLVILPNLSDSSYEVARKGIFSMPYKSSS